MTRAAANSLPGGSGRFWANWLLAIAAWVLHLLLSYSLVEWYCQNPASMEAGSVEFLLNGITGVCLLLALAGGLLAWRSYRRLPAAGGDRGLERWRFMAGSGVALAGFMAALILVEAMPIWVFEVCAR